MSGYQKANLEKLNAWGGAVGGPKPQRPASKNSPSQPVDPRLEQGRMVEETCRKALGLYGLNALMLT